MHEVKNHYGGLLGLSFILIDGAFVDEI